MAKKNTDLITCYFNMRHIAKINYKKDTLCCVTSTENICQQIIKGTKSFCVVSTKLKDRADGNKQLLKGQTFISLSVITCYNRRHGYNKIIKG